jgi:hypothetical protein
MNVTGKHQGIQYDLTSPKEGFWSWTFQPLDGARRFGRVNGEYEHAVAAVHRAIEVSMLINAA